MVYFDIIYPGAAPGIYHGTLNFESASEDFIDAAQLLHYPAFTAAPASPGRDATATTEIPTSIALTQFHFILLYRDQVVAICNLDEKMTYEEVIPLVSELSPLPFQLIIIFIG